VFTKTDQALTAVEKATTASDVLSAAAS